MILLLKLTQLLIRNVLKYTAGTTCLLKQNVYAFLLCINYPYFCIFALYCMHKLNFNVRIWVFRCAWTFSLHFQVALHQRELCGLKLPKKIRKKNGSEFQLVTELFSVWKIITFMYTSTSTCTYIRTCKTPVCILA